MKWSSKDRQSFCSVLASCWGWGGRVRERELSRDRQRHTCTHTLLLSGNFCTLSLLHYQLIVLSRFSEGSPYIFNFQIRKQ